MKFEVVITVWDDGLFKLRTRYEGDADNMRNQLGDEIIDITESKIYELEESRRKIDDDIPF